LTAAVEVGLIHASKVLGPETNIGERGKRIWLLVPLKVAADPPSGDELAAPKVTAVGVPLRPLPEESATEAAPEASSSFQ
jgi:hypothetical protein